MNCNELRIRRVYVNCFKVTEMEKGDVEELTNTRGK